MEEQKYKDPLIIRALGWLVISFCMLLITVVALLFAGLPDIARTALDTGTIGIICAWCGVTAACIVKER